MSEFYGIFSTLMCVNINIFSTLMCVNINMYVYIGDVGACMLPHHLHKHTC